MADPKLVAPEIQIKAMLARMAALAQSLILHRAFTAGTVAKSTGGASAKPLAQDYAWYKSGTRPYKSQETKDKAARRRGQGLVAQGGFGMSAAARRLARVSQVLRGPFGWGPISQTEGGRKRLGVRPAVADQVLSGGTRQAFGKVRESSNSITLGFRTARAQAVSAHLQARNQFFALTPSEEDAVLKIGEPYLHDFAKKIKLRNGTILIVL